MYDVTNSGEMKSTAEEYNFEKVCSTTLLMTYVFMIIDEARHEIQLFQYDIE